MSQLKKLNLLIFFISIIPNVYSQGATNGSVKTYYTTLYDKGVKIYEGNILEQYEEIRSGNTIRKNTKIYKHGQGTSFLTNIPNAYRKGNFSYDNLNGIGEMHAGAIHYVGNWKDNKKNGNGKEWSDGSDGNAKFVYEGGFVNDRYDGKGKFVTDNFSYEGGYSNHSFFGQGKATYSDGGTYSGMFSNGLRNGYGEYNYPNGDIYRGNWLNNKKHGEAEYFSSSTKKTERLVYENDFQKSVVSPSNYFESKGASSNSSSNQTTSFLDKTPIQSGSNLNNSVSKQEKCVRCSGSGKEKEWIDPYTCQNCDDWNESYRSKVACHVCKDTRETPNRRFRMVVCSKCKGTGRDFEQEQRNKEFGGKDWMLSSNSILVINGYLQVHEGYWRSREKPSSYSREENKQKTMLYREAVANCQSLGTGWRLPNFDELNLLFRTQYSGAINLGFVEESDPYPTYYWTSTVSEKKYDYNNYNYVLRGVTDGKYYAERKRIDDRVNDFAACKCVKSN